MLKLRINDLINIRGIKRPFTFLRKHGFSNHKIRLFQSGKANSFNIKDLEYLCEILNCTPNDLFNWEPDVNNMLPDAHPLYKLIKSPDINLAEITTDMSTEEFAEFSKKVLEIKNEVKNNIS